MLGKKIEAASSPNPRSSLRGREGRLAGRQVEEIRTRGKHLLIDLDEGLSLHSHLGMRGSWRVDSGSGFGKPGQGAWLILEFGSARVGQFGGPTLRLVRDAELLREPRLARLGPDILDPAFSVKGAVLRLQTSQDEVGVALLDQTLVCGIGNIFKSEACFEAKVDPWRLANGLDVSEVASLLTVARKQMLQAVDTGRRPGRVYKKTGHICPRCRNSRIQSRSQGIDGRITYWCRRCQG